MTDYFSPLRSYSRALLDTVGALVASRRWLALSDVPQPESEVPTDYFGINVAPSDTAQVDDYLLARLDELGLKQVRMDYCYDSPGGPAQRLLERLLENGFDVLLDVFPPLEQAQRLADDEGAQAQWRRFFADALELYHPRIALFEVGSTPNRGKWSGFSARSYLAAWSIANEVAEPMQVRLAGPNLSDFEPLYNAAFLAFMQRMGAPPAVHTDNLFVERVIEPEAYDHRVLGTVVTDHLKLNLIKKARILQRIGADRQVPTLICSYKCWTAKRLRRRSPWPETKRVDYLVRYLALAASSGALARVYWGPLVCARDGLIDDQALDYPQIDQVSYYQRIRGNQNDFIVTPGFRAFRHCIDSLAGSRVSALLHQVYGLSVFAIHRPGRGTLHLCWTRDAMSVSLDQLYPQGALEGARFMDGCGESIPQPAVICEQPTFIEFNAAPPALKSPVPQPQQDVTALSSPQYQSIELAQDDWRGAFMLRAQQQREDLAAAPGLQPDTLASLPETAVLRDARNRLWNVSDPRGRCQEVTVKLNRVAGIKKVTYRLRASKGRRHWNNACEMLRRGIATPLPVAFYEQLRRPGVRDSWYLCEFIPDAFSARDVYAAFRDGAPLFKGLDRQHWFTLLAGFVCHMHDKGILHRDLSAGNLLIHEHSAGQFRPLAIDIGRAHLGSGSSLSHRARLRDLMRIGYKLDWPARQIFVRCYEKSMGSEFSSSWRLPFHFYDYKQKFKKSLKGKRKKRARSRN